MGPAGPAFRPSFQPSFQLPRYVAVPEYAGAYTWEDHPADPGRQLILKQGQRSVGLYHRGQGVYWPWREGVYGEPCAPPFPVQRVAYEGGGAVPPDHNFGVDEGRRSSEPRYWLNGKLVSKAEAYQAVEKGELKDDSKFNWLVVLGPEAATAPVKKDLEAHPALAPWKGKVRVHVADPTKYFAVADKYGYKGGSPSIYVQAPTGKVLHRQESYRGPEQLAQAMRKADPSYDPLKDPDLNKRPEPKPDRPEPLHNNPLVWLAGLAAVLLLLSRKS